MAKSGKPEGWAWIQARAAFREKYPLVHLSACQKNSQNKRAYAQLWEADEIQPPLIDRFSLSDTKSAKFGVEKKIEQKANVSAKTYITDEKRNRLSLFPLSQKPDWISQDIWSSRPTVLSLPNKSTAGEVQKNH